MRYTQKTVHFSKRGDLMNRPFPDLSASKKFKDTLTGRKPQVWLTPMILQDLADFGNEDVVRRLLGLRELSARFARAVNS